VDKIFSLFRLTQIGRSMFWWTKASISCSNLSMAVTYEHVDSTSSPTCLQSMGRGREPREPSNHNSDILGPSALEDLGDGASSPRVALLRTLAPALRITKSCSKLLTSSPSRGLAPTTYHLDAGGLLQCAASTKYLRYQRHHREAQGCHRTCCRLTDDQNQRGMTPTTTAPLFRIISEMGEAGVAQNQQLVPHAY
jgi:hypothetical protein